MLFTGEYEHTIDAKQRLAVPSEVRSRMEVAGLPGAFYIAPGPNGAIWLWPERTFEEMSRALGSTLLPAEEMMEFEEQLYARARWVEVDKAGRIRLPESVISEAGLGQSVVILGVKDHLELRDPAQWKRQRQEKIAKQSEIMLRARRAMEQQTRSE